MAACWVCFLLGTLTRFATETGAAIGMVFGFALNVWLWQGTFPVHIGAVSIPHIAWTWYVLIGAAATFAVGSLASLCFRRQSSRITVALAAALLGLWLTAGMHAAEPHPAPRAGELQTVPTPMTQSTSGTQEKSDVTPRRRVRLQHCLKCDQ